MRVSRVLIFLAVGAALGLSIFAFFARRATRIEDASPSQAELRFTALRDSLVGRSEALLWLDESGELQHRQTLPTESMEQSEGPSTLGILAYRAADERLTEVVVPFWFVRLKEPALRLVLREVEFDWSRLGLGAEELRRAGPGLVLDEEDGEGNLLLVYLQ